MKNYLLNATGLAFLLFATGCATHDDSQKVIHFVSNPWELSSTIKIPDYKDSLKIMQITDAHISIEDEKESDLCQYTSLASFQGASFVLTVIPK